jgi:glucose/arabinose dehydrogenase
VRLPVLPKWPAAGIAVAVCAIALGPVSASSSPSTTVTTRVDAREFRFTLSRMSAPAGTDVRFVVRNRGKVSHRFRFGSKRTRLLRPGASQAITVRAATKGRLAFLCTVRGHARKGMRGTFAVTEAPTPPPEPEPPLPVSDAAVLTPVATLERPVLVTAPGGDERLFVVEQTGAVRIVRDGTVSETPFFDFRARVTTLGESGLLAIAFAPDYARSGLLYAFYNSRNGPYGDIHVSELRRSAADPDRVDPDYERMLITIPKPYENHNGGMLQFGPDGYLYVSVGDGDTGVLYPPGYFAQRRDNLLGSILRVDPRGGDPYAVPADNPFVGQEGVRPEIWAYGLRNPWRFWIDPETGDLLVADVGSTAREEVNLVRRGESGQNFGWPCFEGAAVVDETASCEDPVAPAFDFPRADGVCAVIGGVVVRDPRIGALQGRYLYGDLCAGTVTAVTFADRALDRSDVLELPQVRGLSSFGVDGRGRVYVTSTRGDVFRLDPR